MAKRLRQQNFAFAGTTRAIPSGQDRPILPARVANQNTGFDSSCPLTCDQAFFFRRSAKEKQRETRRSVGGQSGFSQFLAFPDRHSRVAILSRYSEKITPDRRLLARSRSHPYTVIIYHNTWVTSVPNYNSNLETRSLFGIRRLIEKIQ